MLIEVGVAQSNWTASRMAWTKSTPTCGKPKRISPGWKNVAAFAFYPVRSESVSAFDRTAPDGFM